VSERPSTLPPSWVAAPLEDVVLEPKSDIVDGPFGSNLKASEYVEQGIPIIRLQNVKANRFIEKNIRYISPDKAEELKRHSFKAGDIAISKLGDPLGEACIVPDGLVRGVIVADVVRLRVPEELLDKRAIAYALNSEAVKEQLKALTKGTTRPRVNLSHIREVRIPLPPLKEQSRIVEEIEKQFTRLDAAVAALKRIQANLKRYRAAVLRAACEGRLVPTEAELARREGRSYEPASILLERILAERRSRWEAAQFAKVTKSKYQEPLSPSTDTLPPLPEGWAWATWEQLSPRVTVGHVGPMKTEYVADGFPFLRSQNVRENRFDANGLLHIPKEFHLKLSKSLISGGDLVVVRSGSVGTTCVIPDHLGEANCADLVIIKQPLQTNSWYGCYYMNSSAKRYVHAGKVGVALTHFNTKSVAELPVALPPRAEQDRIVAEVQRRLSVIDEVEVQAEVGLRRADSLRQAILKRAFEGKLIPQDSNDEPTSVLLERIRAARESINEGKSGKSAHARQKNTRSAKVSHG
jgi:type I restriction enzyme S subunit